MSKAKRKIVLNSDEEEAPPESKSKRSQILDELMGGPSTSTGKSTSSTPAASEHGPAPRAALLPTPPTLPVFHLKLEDFRIEDIVVNVSV